MKRVKGRTLRDLGLEIIEKSKSVAIVKDSRNGFLYSVLSKGEIWSENYNRTGKRKRLAETPTRGGYVRVRLGDKMITTHRLVALCLLDNPDNKEDINHIDEDKSNNALDNLEWTNVSDNVNFGTRNKRVADKLRKEVYQYTIDGVLVKIWASVRDCARGGFGYTSINFCCNGKRESHKGYKWSYTELNT